MKEITHQLIFKCNNNGFILNICNLSTTLPLILLIIYILWSYKTFTNYFHQPIDASESNPLIINNNYNNYNSFKTLIISILSLTILISIFELLVIIFYAIYYLSWISTMYTFYLVLNLALWLTCATILCLQYHFFNNINEAWPAFWFPIFKLIVDLPTSFQWWFTMNRKFNQSDKFLVLLLGLLFLIQQLVTLIYLHFTLKHLNRHQFRIFSNYQRVQPPTPTPSPTNSKSLFYQIQQILPYMWPKKDIKLQILVIIAYTLLFLRLVINPLTPYQYKCIVDALFEVEKKETKDFTKVYTTIFIYGFIKLLQGSNGLINSLQSWVLIPINQYVTNTVSIEMFSHLHSLSLDFHIKRKTGEVLRMMDRGTSSIVSLMNYLVFSLFPAIMDIVIALIILYQNFDYAYSITFFISMSFYIWATISITQWRTKFRRDMNELNNKVGGIAVDSLLNFETVKYFNAENFETIRYSEAMKNYLDADRKNSASLPVLNLIQNIILTLGLLISSLLCAYEITNNTKDVGHFVYLNSYLLQLAVPLNFFGTLYRMIQQNFIDMEKMLELKEQNQSIKDISSAKELKVSNGNIEFNKVCFRYNEDKIALNEISFTIPNGKTVALVGPSGGGKSTILKLLFRFYDCNSGFISIDQQNINLITQSSLRKAIGVVPQDTVLFNDTIKYNIAYGKPDASDEEIHEAAKMASIHDKILSFPKGYDTIVGERGLRLSGGEKQRVAIARTILKNPKIVLLDEATSALDINTERQIQESFNSITTGRTTLVIAHRLSTIVNSDIILYIKDGKVAESGSHQELIKIKNGLYATMWEKQLFEQ